MNELSKSFGAVVLAAGASRRMGTNKALLPVGGSPMLLGIVRSLLDCSTSIQPLIVITGHQSDAIEQALTAVRDRIEFAHNNEPDAGGMLSSIKVGLNALRDRARFIFIVLGDQPLVQPQTIEKLMAASDADVEVIRPIYRGKHGHPILLNARCLQRILDLSASATLNDFVKFAKVLDVDVTDPATLQDIDTPDDYRALLDGR